MKRFCIKVLKIAAWTLMALTLLVLAAGICVARLLQPEQLTRVANSIANEMFDAKVNIGRVDFNFMEEGNVLNLAVDDVSVLSNKILRLPQNARADLPSYADTLLTIKRFEGGVNPIALLANEIKLYDVRFVAPQANIVIVNDSLANYHIFASGQASEELAPAEQTPTDTAAFELPGIFINRFSIENPQPIRYHDIAAKQLVELRLRDITLEGADAPSYTIDFGGDVSTAMLEQFNRHTLQFGMGGGIVFDPEGSGRLELNDFEMAVDSLRLTTNLSMTSSEPYVIDRLSAELAPVKISRLIEFVPDSLLIANGIKRERIDTDLQAFVTLRALEAFELTPEAKPEIEVGLSIPPSKFNYGPVRFKRLGGEVRATLKGTDPATARINVKNLTIQGPATNLLMNATAQDVMNDPWVNGSVFGHTDIDLLPPPLRKLIPGTASGKITANLSFKGRSSMLTPEKFHKLQLSGDIDADEFYFDSSDSLISAFANHACFKFGTNKSYGDMDSLLTASIRVDSARINYDLMAMRLNGLTLGVETSNKRSSADTTAINPIGGGVKVDRMSLVMLEDSSRIRVRELMGHVSLQRYMDNARLPQLSLKLQARSVSAGMPDARIFMSSPQFNATAFKKPRPKMPEAIAKAVDSLLAANPTMPRDSAFATVIRQRRKHRGYRGQRNQAEFTAQESEIINWGTSNSARRFLMGWDMRGSVSARRAMMFTTAFPVRCRLSNFDLAFTNDSITLTNTRMRAGASDFTVNGCISNIKRSFTSRGYRAPLLIDFDVASDSIDVNEIAAAVFGGSEIQSPAPAPTETDAEFESEIVEMAAEADTVRPLLIPHNIDMRLNMRSNNIFYADLGFTNFHGEILAAQGALNMRDLSAKSEMGNLKMTALYAAPRISDMSFGFGMLIDRFDIRRFTQLMPAIDSIVPMMKDISGIVNANIAMSSKIDPQMNIDFPSLNAAVQISGDSLQLLDKETYRTIGKWLMFKDKQNNIIKHLDIEFTIADNLMQLYPRIFEIDRYKLGIQGSNDMALNFDYHIAVLKSPLPFKFGLNLKGNADDFNISLGKARFNEKEATQYAFADTTRINLVREIENVFRRGVENSRFKGVDMQKRPQLKRGGGKGDTISHADSLVFIERGVLPRPPRTQLPANPQPDSEQSSEKQNKRQNTEATKDE